MDEETVQPGGAVRTAERRFTLAQVFALSLGTSLCVSALAFALFMRSESTASTPTPPATAQELISLDERERRVTSLVERASNAVASVVVTKDVPVYERYYEEYDPFEGWGGFGGFQVPRVREKGSERREVGGGTGFFVSQDGLLITNRHVVSDTEAEYSVLLNDGSSVKAKVLARDPQLDIAVLKVEGSAPSYLALGNSDALKPGQTVVAIGNALGEFRNSVSVGVVSGLARSIVAGDGRGEAEYLEGVIQTDAAINPGNSGGPLLNLAGEVIGVNVAVAGGAENIGFALPSSMLKNVVDSVKATGEIRRAFLGVRYVMVTPELARGEDLPVTYGALIRAGENEAAVPEGSPARSAGLRGGDLITAFAGESLEKKSLAAVIRTKNPGESVVVEYYRGGEKQTVTVTLGTM